MIRGEFDLHFRTEVEIEVHFSAGHRILGHAGKCRHLHGHSYTARVRIDCRKLNELGMVVDFGDLKKFVKGWIDEHWDHNMILNSLDPLLIAGIDLRILDEVLSGKAPYCIGSGLNPTAENMAQELYMVIHNNFLPENYEKLKGRNVWLQEVAIKEEEGSWARYVR